MHNNSIDLVYLWVDGNDPEWLEKKHLFTSIPSKSIEADAAGRYANNDELKYSLRSVEKHAPWIRNIYIVTDNQKPEWLNTDHPKIKVIDHKDILPTEVLPTFNSCVIEYFLYKIPNLSEYFLYANDDCFFNADLSPDYFFEKDGYPIVCLKRKLLGKWHYKLKGLIFNLGQYQAMVTDTMNLIEQKFGKSYAGIPHHNIDSFRKSDYRKAVEEVFTTEIKNTQHHRTRNLVNLQRSVFSYYPLAIGHAHVKYVGRKESSRILIYKHNFTEYIKRYHPLLFCLNDDQYVTNEQRHQVKPFLETLFPVKSVFEK